MLPKVGPSDQGAAASPGNLLERRILFPAAELLIGSSRSVGWATMCVSPTLSADCDTPSNLRVMGLEHQGAYGVSGLGVESQLCHLLPV